MPAGRILLKSISESKKLAALKTDGARLLYTWLIPHVDVNGCFSGDIEVIKGQIFTRLKKSDREIESFLCDLEEAGLIVRYESEGDAFIFLPTFEEKQPHLNKEREAAPRIPRPTPEQLKSKSGLNQDKIPLKFKVKVKVKENVEILTPVVEYLNQKTGKNFSPTSTATLRHINARIAEGRTFEDFKHVIDVKVRSWLDDPKMNAYLRPETLFGSKMEAYLNEYIVLTPVEKERIVGAGRPISEEERAKRKEGAAKIKALATRIFDEKFNPKMDEARARGDLKAVTALQKEAEAEFRIESSKIMRGEA